MPVKILTDQPQNVRRTIQAALTTTLTTLAEAPYFSVPLADEDVATIDPADANRELRPGEVFFATAIQIANNTDTARTVTVTLVSENGLTTHLAPGLTVPANDVLSLAPGLSLFKTNLATPGNDGMRLRASASIDNALTLTATVIEREQIQHSPDTET
jgi:hypothetical protein